MKNESRGGGEGRRKGETKEKGDRTKMRRYTNLMELTYLYHPCLVPLKSIFVYQLYLF